MTVENLKSASITNLDASPVVANVHGTGAAAYQYIVSDTVAPTASGLGSTTSTYRIVRIPSNAKVTSVKLAVGAALDSNASPTLVFDLNLAFSDSTVDGTQPTLQGTIPTSANTGATTTIASYSSPNIIFGQTTGTQAKTTMVQTKVDFTFNGSQTNYPIKSLNGTELWSLFGFTNPYSVAQDPGGYFDLLAYVSTAAATGVAGTVYGEIAYVV
jgi:hypothetical protein